MTTRIGSLFTGYGGLDLAARALFPDARTAWVCDIKPAAVALLEHRLPGVPNLGDITRVGLDYDDETWAAMRHRAELDDGWEMPEADWSDVEPVDLLTFGWPCQPFSPAGKRLGEADPRALWPYIIRAVQELRPRVLLGENVARVATNSELRRVVSSLAALGYVGAWRCVTAAEIGAPHKRDRLALAAVRGDAVADTLGRGFAQHPQRDGAPLGGAGAPPLGVDLVRRGARAADRLTLLPTPHQNCTTGAGTSGRDGGLNLQTAVTLLPTPLKSDAGPRAGTTGYGLRNWSREVTRDADPPARWGIYTAAVERWEQVLGRPAPAPTQLGSRGGFQLAPRFVEWMMGLPEGWVTDIPDLAPRPLGHRNAQLSLLGDGVVPQQLAHGFRLALADLADARGVAA